MTLRQQFKKQVITVRPHDTIRHTVDLMRDHNVGAVVVENDKEEPVETVTDREIALAVVGENCDPNTSVCFIMSSDPVTIDQHTGIWNATQTMLDHHVRLLVIVDSEFGTVTGIVTMDDLFSLLARELSSPEGTFQPVLAAAV